MTHWVALLRAVNVGGTGKIEMAQLRETVSAAGLREVRSYIASGNLVFSGPDDPAEVRAWMHAAIAREFGACPDLFLRTSAQMREVVARNPFASESGSKVLVIFTDGSADAEGLRYQATEMVVASGQEIFIHYPLGMGQSKLIVPAASQGTGRNMNTVARLAEMAAQTR